MPTMHDSPEGQTQYEMTDTQEAMRETLTDESEIKQAEHRGYSKGYQAGKRRKEREDDYARLKKERRAFIDRAFIAILPAAMVAEGWRFGDKPITSTEDRVKLARIWAEQALKQRPTI